jgi:hypothetical protein
VRERGRGWPRGALSDLASAEIYPTHPGVGAERHEGRAEGVNIPSAQAEPVLRQDHDAAAFGRLVGERGQLRGVRQFLYRHAACVEKRRRVPVAERDGTGLVEQEDIDVARSLHGPAGHGDHVLLHHPPHAGNADGGKQRPMVVGMRQTSNATSTVTVTGTPAFMTSTL